jgi:hypothetical protein
MSHELRKNVVFVVVALLVVAMVLASTGCTTNEGDDRAEPLTDLTYPAALDEICAATASELDAVPDPPEQISRVDWAGEVSRVLDNEANRFDALRVTVDLREPHGSLVRTARAQAEQLALLGDVLDESTGDSTDIESISDEIRSLSLGREELATELGAPSCGTRSLT